MKRVLIALALCAPLFVAAADDAPAAAGKDAFTQGDATVGASKAPVCFACHGPGGAGNAAGQFPRIGGQNSGYAANQLKSYKSGERGAAGKGQIMATIAAKLSDQEIQALSSYVSGLQ